MNNVYSSPKKSTTPPASRTMAPDGGTVKYKHQANDSQHKTSFPHVLPGELSIAGHVSYGLALLILLIRLPTQTSLSHCIYTWLYETTSPESPLRLYSRSPTQPPTNQTTPGVRRSASTSCGPPFATQPALRWPHTPPPSPPSRRRSSSARPHRLPPAARPELELP